MSRQPLRASVLPVSVERCRFPASLFACLLNSLPVVTDGISSEYLLHFVRPVYPEVLLGRTPVDVDGWMLNTALSMAQYRGSRGGEL